MFSKDDLMQKKVSHHIFYSQFVTDRTIEHVKKVIGHQQIMASRCVYFNDIPLKKWDDMIGWGRNGTNGFANMLPYDIHAYRVCVGEVTYFSDLICVAKCAATYIRDCGTVKVF